MTRTILVLVCLALAACDGDRQTPGGKKNFVWKQEARLSDGRIIVVDRDAKQSGTLFPENAVIEYEKRLSFTNPDTNEKVEWTLPKGTGSWLLDFDGGIPYLVLKTSSIADYNDWECPNPPWLVFRYEDKIWKRISIEALPERFVTPNLLHAARTDEKASKDGYVTVAEMDERLQGHPLPEYKTIGRNKIDANVHGCFPSVLMKLGRANEITERIGIPTSAQGDKK